MTTANKITFQLFIFFIIYTVFCRIFICISGFCEPNRKRLIDVQKQRNWQSNSGLRILEHYWLTILYKTNKRYISHLFYHKNYVRRISSNLTNSMLNFELCFPKLKATLFNRFILKQINWIHYLTIFCLDFCWSNYTSVLKNDLIVLGLKAEDHIKIDANTRF